MAYTKVGWEDAPSEKTPVNAENLDHMDEGIAQNAEDIEKINNEGILAAGISGARNIIPYPHYQTTRTVNGITFTDNGDGTIHVKGTATASTSHAIRAVAENWIVESGTYVLSGCPSGGSFSTYRLQVARFVDGTLTSYANEYGAGAVVEITDGLPLLLQIVIASGVTIDAIFRPMLERGTVMHNFVPYHVGGAEHAFKAENAEKLGGKSAEEYAKMTDLANYLPLIGGGTIEFTNYNSFTVKRNTTNKYVFTGIMFADGNGQIGMIGFRNGKLQRGETNGSTGYEILDTSNSVKVVLSETPLSPTDTDKIRFW